MGRYKKLVSLNPDRYEWLLESEVIYKYLDYVLACFRHRMVEDSNRADEVISIKSFKEWLDTEI